MHTAVTVAFSCLLQCRVKACGKILFFIVFQRIQLKGEEVRGNYGEPKGNYSLSLSFSPFFWIRWKTINKSIFPQFFSLCTEEGSWMLPKLRYAICLIAYWCSIRCFFLHYTLWIKGYEYMKDKNTLLLFSQYPFTISK